VIGLPPGDAKNFVAQSRHVGDERGKAEPAPFVVARCLGERLTIQDEVIDRERSLDTRRDSLQLRVVAATRQAFLQTDTEAAHRTWRHVANQLRARWPKLATLMDESEHDVFAHITFPAQHRTKIAQHRSAWTSQ
jgi:transposase-like protein